MPTTRSTEFWRLGGTSFAATFGMLIVITLGYYWPIISFGPLIGALGLLVIVGAIVVDVRRGLDVPQRKVNVVAHSVMLFLSVLWFAFGVVVLYVVE